MWHNVGLTLLVFVATLLIVLLLMVCGEWGHRRGWSGKRAWASVWEPTVVTWPPGQVVWASRKLSVQGWHPDSR